MRPNFALLAVGFGFALETAACGTESAPSTAATTVVSDASETVTSQTGPTAPASENLFPDIDVAVVGSGETVNLKQELGGGDRPVLLWFWAPH